MPVRRGRGGRAHSEAPLYPSVAGWYSGDVRVLAVAVVPLEELGVLGVVDVLHVEVDAELPDVEEPVLVDAQVELVEERVAIGARGAGDGDVVVGVGVVDAAEDGVAGRPETSRKRAPTEMPLPKVYCATTVRM